MSDFFPQFPPRRRKAHVWRLRGHGFRAFLMSHGWTPCGGFARKMVRGTEYLMFTVGGHDSDQRMVRIIAKDDHWADLAAQERQRAAVKRRREFEVLDAHGRRPAIRYVPCLTIMLESEDEGSA